MLQRFPFNRSFEVPIVSSKDSFDELAERTYLTCGHIGLPLTSLQDTHLHKVVSWVEQDQKALKRSKRDFEGVELFFEVVGLR